MKGWNKTFKIAEFSGERKQILGCGLC